MMDFLLRRWHRLTHRPVPEVGPLRPVRWSEPDRLAREVLETGPLLTRILRENILPFWLPGTLDREHGGYLVHHDPAGRWKGPCDKHVIPQARTVWFFARLARTGGYPGALEAAAHGMAFLRRMWDADRGGLVWAVDHEGNAPRDDRKRLTGHSFALYAAAEYARASGDAGALDFSRAIVETLETRFRDPVHGGYRSALTGDWQPAEVDGGRKGMDGHLHLLEAYTTWVAVSGDELARRRLWELMVTLTSTVLRKTRGAGTDRHREDWTPLLDRQHARVNYGHDLEATWLVLDACAVLGLPGALVADWCRALFACSLRWGWDRRRGGLYDAGPLGGPADDRRKTWWAQAETLVGALRVYALTGDEALGRCYLDTLRWIAERHVDWEGGEWHAIVHASGRVTGDKAGPWKTPYHNGRAMLRCLELLEGRTDP